jgi:hypothetical protein
MRPTKAIAEDVVSAAVPPAVAADDPTGCGCVDAVDRPAVPEAVGRSAASPSSRPRRQPWPVPSSGRHPESRPANR